MKHAKKLLIVVGIIATVFISFLCGNTFSKYATQVTGNGNGEIAKWFFKVNGTEDQINNIDLGKTQDEQTLLNGKIAPGSTGKFDIIIDTSEAEVGIDYKISFQNEVNKPTNLKFEYQGNQFNSLKDLESNLSGLIPANSQEKIKTITINWKWPYETGENTEEITKNDNIDTQEAKNGNNYHFDVLVSGTQVMPK